MMAPKQEDHRRTARLRRSGARIRHHRLRVIEHSAPRCQAHETWEYLASDVVPEVIKRRPNDAPLRAWCASCASGEEPYRLAMVLARALGDNVFQDRVAIYATDVDEQAPDITRYEVPQSCRLPRRRELAYRPRASRQRSGLLGIPAVGRLRGRFVGKVVAAAPQQ